MAANRAGLLTAAALAGFVAGGLPAQASGSGSEAPAMSAAIQMAKAMPAGAEAAGRCRLVAEANIRLGEQRRGSWDVLAAPARAARAAVAASLAVITAPWQQR